MIPLLAPQIIIKARPPVIVGSTNYTTSGSILVPEYNTLIITGYGPGGGGGSGVVNHSAWPNGTAGGTTSIASLGLYAYGGARGEGVWTPDSSTYYSGANGSNGGASGGDTNTAGGGAAGGAGGYVPGGYPGEARGGNGGYGGRWVKTFTYGAPGAPVPGTLLAIVCGAAGVGYSYSIYSAGYGGAGYINFNVS